MRDIQVTYERSRRQNVSLTAQLLSYTSATVLKKYLLNPKKGVAIVSLPSIKYKYENTGTI